jgi:uroporphyrin-3 C-methyltransferase
MDDSETRHNGETPAAQKGKAPPEPALAEKPPAAVPGRLPSVLALLAILLAVGLSAAVWYDARQHIDATREEMARRLRELENENRDAGVLARQSQDAVRELQGKLAQIDGRLNEARDQQRSLEALFQGLARNRDDTQLAEIEQVLEIASQQLQLSGNVRAALLALQFADARLARADRPQFMPIRRALARDVEKLKAVQVPDLPGLAVTLDALIAAVDGLPLAMQERAPGATAERGPPSAEGGTLARLGADLWRELRELVVLRRVDSPEPPLLPPTQAYFLRENLRLRLLNARVSLLVRDQVGYRSDLGASRDWIKRFFDTRSTRVGAALSRIDELLSASLETELPSISDSLQAVRSLELRRESGS